MKALLKRGTLWFISGAIFTGLVLMFLCSPYGAKKALWLRLSFAEIFTSVLNLDEYDPSRGAILINNKESLQSMKQMLVKSKCEKSSGDDMVPGSCFYIGAHQIGCDIYFEYRFLLSHYHFVFPSSVRLSWQEYVGGIREGIPGYGFVLKE